MTTPRPRNRHLDTTFTLTDQHLKLLQRMYVSWGYIEHGAPEINPKRPYGNSDVHRDIAEILGMDTGCPCSQDYRNCVGLCRIWLEANCDMLEQLHKDTETALQIVLCTASFEPGEYVQAKKYHDRSWQKITAPADGQ